MLHNRPLADITHALSVIPHRHRPDQQREPDRARHAPYGAQHQETARQRLCRGRQFGLPEGEDSHQAEEEIARDSHDGEGVEDAITDGLDGAVEVAAGGFEEDGAGEASEGEVGEAGDGGEEDEGDDESAVQGFVREDVQEEEAEGDFEGDKGEGEEAGGPLRYLWEVVRGQWVEEAGRTVSFRATARGWPRTACWPNSTTVMATLHCPVLRSWEVVSGGGVGEEGCGLTKATTMDQSSGPNWQSIFIRTYIRTDTDNMTKERSVAAMILISVVSLSTCSITAFAAASEVLEVSPMLAKAGSRAASLVWFDLQTMFLYQGKVL